MGKRESTKREEARFNAQAVWDAQPERHKRWARERLRKLYAKQKAEKKLKEGLKCREGGDDERTG